MAVEISYDALSVCPLWGSQLSQRESQGVLPYLPAKLQFLQDYRAIHVIDEINSELPWDQRPKVVGLLFCT